MLYQVNLFSRLLRSLSIPKAKQSSTIDNQAKLFSRSGKHRKSPSVISVLDFSDMETIGSPVESEAIADYSADDLTEEPLKSHYESLDLVDGGDVTGVGADVIELDWDPIAQEQALDKTLDETLDKESIAAVQKTLTSDREETADVVVTGVDGADGADGANGVDAVVEEIPDVTETGDAAIDPVATLDNADEEAIDPVAEAELEEETEIEDVASTDTDDEEETDEDILVDTPVLLSDVTRGLSVVTDPSGKLSIIWKFDGGAYEGQVGVVSTAGMENYDLNSIEFMQEAIRRALANIIVDDTTEGAEFGGFINGEDSNHGEFTGEKIVQLSAGEQFFLALIPNGTFADVLASLEAGELPTGANRPLFSLATANPEDMEHFVQLVDLNGKGTIFALEDIRADEKSDWDLNDLVITIKGANVGATSLGDLIEFGVISEAPQWLESDLGIAILESAVDDLIIQPVVVIPERYEFPKADQPLVGFIDTLLTKGNPDIDYSRIILGKDWNNNDSDPTVEASQKGNHLDHLLGIVGATQDNGLGIDGINDDAPLWVSSAVGSGKWADALVEFVDAVKASGQPTGVINLSIDLTQVNPDGSISTRYEFTPSERAALELARQNDILVVVSIGNESGVPSALGQASQEFHNIITVGAAKEVTLPDGTLSYARANYSNYGDTLDIVAPGGTATNPVISTVGDGIGNMSGTSVATAKVTGAASLVWAANPELNALQVIEILKKSATDINTLGWDAETGAGLLNIAAAVNLGRITQGEEYKPLQKDIPLVWGETGKPIERPASVSTGSNLLISKNNQGVLGNSSSYNSSMSADGNIIAYESYSSDLVNGDTNGKRDIFVFNRITGQTSRVNVSSSGVQSLTNDESPVVSANGRFVAFISYDLNLVPGISGASTGANVFVRDLVNNTTEIVSVDRWGRASGVNTYFGKKTGISEDGRYVTFSSYSDDLVSGDNNKQRVYSDVFIYDRQLKTTKKVTTNTNGGSQEPTSAYNATPVISDDGKFAAFIADESFSPTSPGQKNVYIRNLVSGIISSVSPSIGWDLAISGKGERLAFSSPGGFSVYETATGKLRQISNLVSTNDFVYGVDISQNGRYATFVSYPLPGVSMSYPMEEINSVIYRYDLETNEIIAIQTDNLEVPGRYNRNPVISADGRYIVFDSSGTNLAVNDTNGASDIVFHDTQGTPKPFGLGKIDLVANSFELVQSSLKKGESFDIKFKVENKGINAAKNVQVDFGLLNDTNTQSNGYWLGTYKIDNLAGGSSQEFIAKIDMPASDSTLWQYYKGNLQLKMVVDPYNYIAETDENNIPLVVPISFDKETGITTQITTNSSSNQPTNIQAINSDGSLIVYDTDTSTYVYNTVTGQKQEFPQKQDIATGFSKPKFSSDGNTYLYLENDGSLFVYDRITGTRKFLAKRPGNNTGSMPYWMSESGRYVTYAPQTNGKHTAYVYDRVSNTTSIDYKLSDFMNTYQLSLDWQDLSTSVDDSKMTFTATTYNPITQTAFMDLFLYDKNVGVIKPITSTSQPQFKVGSPTPPVIISDNLISSDGKFIVFTSLDPSLVGAGNNKRDIFIYEVATGITKKAGIDNNNYSGGIGVEDISKDGRYILFSPDNGIQSLYVYDTVTGKSTQINVDANGVGSLGGINGFYGLGKITEDGKKVVFISKASDLVAGDTNGLADIFIRDWQPKKAQIVGVPDLMGQSLSIPSGATAGELLDTQFQLRNNGDAAANFRVGFYISQDGNISKTDKLIGFQTVDSVPANGSTPSLRTILTLPPAGDPFWNGTGKYYIGMIADDEGAIPEANEANNLNQGSGIDLKEINITVPVQGDLSASALNISKSSVSGGDVLQSSLLVSNNTANNMDGFRVGFYISDSPNITKNDKLLGTKDVAALAGNTALTVTADLNLPSFVDSFWKNPGTYYIGAIVDDQNKFKESSEANNVMATPFEYKGVVDLAGGYFNIASSNNKIGIHDSFNAGDTIQTQFQVNNNSSGQTGAVKVSFYLSEWGKDSPTDPIIGSYTINSIAGNSNTGLITHNIQLPTDLAAYGRLQEGGFKIRMIIDPNDSVKEINESNNFNLGAGIDSKNIMIMTGKLRLPDLTGNILSAPASLKPGDSFNLQYSLSNSGGGAASSFQPNFYLIDRNNPDGGFALKELSKIPAISLPSNSSSGVQNIQLTLPDIGAAFWQGGSGNYAIQMVTDPLNQVTEFNERNNETNYPVQINIIPIFGAFLDKWRRNSGLGLPTGVMQDRGNGVKIQYFEKGHIYGDNTGVYVYKTGGAGQGIAPPNNPSYQERIVPGVTTGVSNSGRWIYDGYLNKSQDNLTFRVDQRTPFKFSLNNVDANLVLFRDVNTGTPIAYADRKPDGTYFGETTLEPGNYILSVGNANSATDYRIVANFNNQPTSVETGRRTISTRNSLANQGNQITNPTIPLPSSQNIKENWGLLEGRREFQPYYSNSNGKPDWFEFRVDGLTNLSNVHNLQFALRDIYGAEIPKAKIEIVDINGRLLNVDRPGEVPIAVLPNGKYYVRVTPSQAGMNYKVVMNVDSAKDNLLSARDLGKLTGRATFSDFAGDRGDKFGDLYRFQVEKDSFVRFAAKLPSSPEGDLDIVLMNSSGQELVKGDSTNYGDKQLSPGTYYLKVNPVWGSTNYDLVTQVAETLGDLYGRREVYAGKAINHGYQDAFHSFTLGKKTDLSMALKNLSADVDFELRLDNGTGLIGSTYISSNDGSDQWGTNDELKYFRDLAPGKYFVRVINKNNAQSAKYDLVLNASSNITEENIGSLKSRYENFGYVGSASNQRSYTFTVDQAMKVNFSLENPNRNSSDNMMNANLRLLDSSGKDVMLTSLKKNGSINSAEAQLKPGTTYKLLVTPSSGGSNYKLAIDPIFPVISPPIGGGNSGSNGGPITTYAQFLNRLYGHDKGVITQEPNPLHLAIDSVNQGSSPYNVYALASGVIKLMTTDQFGGNYIDIWNEELKKTFRYLHFEKFNSNLKPGMTINAGEFIGVEGYTGNTVPKGSAGRHTHFAVVNANNKEEYPWSTLNKIPNNSSVNPVNPSVSVGSGLDTVAKKAIFQAAYKARMTNKGIVGVNPIRNANYSDNGWIQEFQKGNDKFVLTLKDGSSEAFWLLGENLKEYDRQLVSNQGNILGYLLSNEYMDGDTLFADFERGRIASKNGKIEVLKLNEQPSWRRGGGDNGQQVTIDDQKPLIGIDKSYSFNIYSQDVVTNTGLYFVEGAYSVGGKIDVTLNSTDLSASEISKIKDILDKIPKHSLIDDNLIVGFVVGNDTIKTNYTLNGNLYTGTIGAEFEKDIPNETIGVPSRDYLVTKISLINKLEGRYYRKLEGTAPEKIAQFVNIVINSGENQAEAINVFLNKNPDVFDWILDISEKGKDLAFDFMVASILVAVIAAAVAAAVVFGPAIVVTLSQAPAYALLTALVVKALKPGKVIP